jgi:VIT1/CCC1 family predicted Fe2+/Mn2+ transporter
MAERTEERTREAETSGSDLGLDIGESESTETEVAVGETQTTESAVTDADTKEGGSYFSLRALLFAFGAVGGGMVLGGLIPLVPFTELLGVLLGGFVYGLLVSERRYLEMGIAGAVSGGVMAVLSLLPQLAAGLNGTRLFAIAGGVGLVLSLVGHYFGRDLRNGLTKDI